MHRAKACVSGRCYQRHMLSQVHRRLLLTAVTVCPPLSTSIFAQFSSPHFISHMRSRRSPLIIRFTFATLLITLLTATSCGKKKDDETFVIGFSQCMTDDVWRRAMEIEMRIEASGHDNLTIIQADAHENNEQQIRQIRDMIRRKVDVLIISPNRPEQLTSVAVEAYRAGIPTIIVDRKIDSDEYTAYVGGDSYRIGQLAGQEASRLLRPHATILEVWGARSTSPAQERHAGFVDGLDKTKNLRIISIDGDWRREIARTAAAGIDWSEVDLIYAHNDEMALGARDALIEKNAARLRSIRILGVDGAFGHEAGLEAVADGRLDASFLYPTGGDQVIKVALQILRGEKVKKDYILGTALIDKPTATTLLMQSNQLISYQSKIEQQRKNMSRLSDRFVLLRHSNTAILVLLTLVAAFAVYSLVINRKIRRANAQLRAMNDETERQKEQLVALNERIREATDQKVRFFMNVSHEIKTPLTLIIAPLMKWIRHTDNERLRADLMRMKNSTDRLMRLIEQLLDFRKVETRTSEIHRKKCDIVHLVASAARLFDDAAETHRIDYAFETDAPAALVEIDPDKIEKVCVNLLSNAFKFTDDGGRIVISLKTREREGLTIITVTDNGIGIAPEKLPLVFHRFYSENKAGRTGTGIGLHLSQEFVRMHGGRILVDSEPDAGTTFTVELPLTSATPKAVATPIPEVAPEEVHLTPGEAALPEQIIGKKYPYTILIVEDDAEIREYLTGELSDTLRVVTADSGARALELLGTDAADITLVLSDVLMPGMNGFELCRIIKTTPRLAHLPVILLTALVDDDRRLYGIAEGADDYIPKPFDIDYVKIKIIRLLEERRRLTQHFMRTMQTGRIPIEENKADLPTTDRLFMERFAALLNDHFDDPELSVERISRDMGVSRVHLYRRVKTLSGLSPVDYMRNFRLGKAAELLRQRRFSISEVAYRTGFSSPPYFSKCFKETFGMTPSEYVDSLPEA